MPINDALVKALNQMCPAAQKVGLGDRIRDAQTIETAEIADGAVTEAKLAAAVAARLITYQAGTVTITAANGQGTVSVPSAWGTNYIVVTTLLSGPDAALGCMVTARGSGSATLLVYGVNTGNGNRVAVDCSTTNAVVAYVAVKTS